MRADRIAMGELPGWGPQDTVVAIDGGALGDVVYISFHSGDCTFVRGITDPGTVIEVEAWGDSEIHAEGEKFEAKVCTAKLAGTIDYDMVIVHGPLYYLYLKQMPQVGRHQPADTPIKLFINDNLAAVENELEVRWTPEGFQVVQPTPPPQGPGGAQPVTLPDSSPTTPQPAPTKRSNTASLLGLLAAGGVALTALLGGGVRRG